MGSSVFSRIFLVLLFLISVLIVNFIFSPIERLNYIMKLGPEVKTLYIDGDKDSKWAILSNKVTGKKWMQ